MRALVSRRGVMAVATIGVLAALALWPSAVPVDVARAAHGPLVVTIEDEGETRVRDRFVVSAPIAARVLRIELEPGDPVVRDRTVLARLLPEPSSLLDARSAAEALAAMDAADATLGRARTEEQRAVSARDLATTELRRSGELLEAGLTSPQAFDQAETTLRLAEDAVASAAFAVSTARAELERARARLTPSTLQARGRVVEVRSPVNGVVLRRLQESESVVRQGAPLLEIGDLSQLEIVADLLSSDAVQVHVGARVIVEQWGGATPLDARVRRVEPSAFTKVSALGVEEQRVNVVMDPEGSAASWTRLGDAFRVDVGIVTWDSPEVLKVPTSALFRHGDGWAVYLVDGGRARLTSVEIGHRSGREAEVLGGVTEGATIVVHPDENVTDGARVTIRTAS